MDTQADASKAVQKTGPGYWAGLVAVYLFIPFLLFLCAWDLLWWQGWAFSVLVFAVGLVSRGWAERRHPGILTERTRSATAADAKPWDKVLAPLMAVSVSFPLVIVAGLDHRFGWSSAFSLWLNILGLILIALGYALATWAIAENRFFSGTVRIQAERGHVVCDTGPYRFLRHPGYAGNILPLPGIALALSSLWTIIPAAAALIIIVIRTVLEDRTLQEELPGYLEYAQRVRYRLFPGLY